MTAQRPGPSREDLVAWLDRWTSPGRKPAIVMVSLSYCADILSQQPLGTRPLPKGLSDEQRRVEVECLVRELYQQAEGWAARSSRPQQFALAAYRSDDTGLGPVDTIPFMVEPGGDFAPREEGDPRDVIGTLQRYASDAQRALGQNLQQCMDGLREENESLRRRCATLGDQLIKLVLQQQDLLDRKVVREVDAEDRRVMIGLKQQAGSLVFALIARKLEEGRASPGAGATSQEDPSSPVPAAAVARLLVALTEDQRRLFLPLWPAVQRSMTREGRAELERTLRAATSARPAANGAPPADPAPSGEAPS